MTPVVMKNKKAVMFAVDTEVTLSSGAYTFSANQAVACTEDVVIPAATVMAVMINSGQYDLPVFRCDEIITVP